MYLNIVERKEAEDGYNDSERGLSVLLLKIFDKLSPRMKTELCIKFIQKWPQLIPRALREQAGGASNDREYEQVVNGITSEIRSSEKTLAQ